MTHVIAHIVGDKYTPSSDAENRDTDGTGRGQECKGPLPGTARSSPPERKGWGASGESQSPVLYHSDCVAVTTTLERGGSVDVIITIQHYF